MNIEVIRKLLKKELKEGKKQIELANKIGVSHATIYKLINTNTNPTTDTIQKIATYFKMSLSDLIDSERRGAYQSQAAGEKVRRVPVIRKMQDIMPDRIREGVTDYLWLADVHERIYVMVAGDDAMAPAIKKGDYVLFTLDEEGNEGAVVIVENEWGDLMVRRLKGKKGETFLTGENQEYRPIPLSEKVRIVGRATETLSRRKI